MRRLALLLALVAALGPPALGQRTHYVSPDVPTNDPGGSPTVFMPWDVLAYKDGINVYTPLPVISLPPGTPLDAAHKMDKPGHWLFSVEATTELPPGGGAFFQPEDVFEYDGSSYIMRFDGSLRNVPPGVNVDAVFLDTDDFGNLILSFDVPTTIGANTYEPADLVRWNGGSSYGWFFQAAAYGSGIALSSNTTGADALAHPGSSYYILSLDVPTDLLPSAPPATYVPGDITAWDTALASYTHWASPNLAGWPLSSEVDAYSCQANPGRVYERSVYPFPITMNKSTTTPGNVILSWSPSCSSGAEDYGVYEGTLGSWYNHNQILCSDTTGGPYDEDFTPASGSNYYLVVPHNGAEEGAYGQDFDYSRVPLRLERPQASGSSCAPVRVVTACP